eukprot:scaffold34610_cov197-Amphora_coffeaeformis.AAC.2
MDNGKIAEEGHPEDLLRKPNGLYAHLAREQGILPAEDDVKTTSINGSSSVDVSKGNQTIASLYTTE